jgi:protein involved in polysaccharide export with SLBB domain
MNNISKIIFINFLFILFFNVMSFAEENIDVQDNKQDNQQVASVNFGDIQTQKKQYFHIIGEVKKPGDYPLEQDNNQLLDTINIAGGFTDFASLKNIEVRRINGAERNTIKLDASKMIDKDTNEFQILDGDIIYVPSMKAVSVGKKLLYYVGPVFVVVLAVLL